MRGKRLGKNDVTGTAEAFDWPREYKPFPFFPYGHAVITSSIIQRSLFYCFVLHLLSALNPKSQPKIAHRAFHSYLYRYLYRTTAMFLNESLLKNTYWTDKIEKKN